MKTKFKLFIMLLLFLSIDHYVYAQQVQKNPTIINAEDAGGAQALSPSEFNASTVLIQDFSAFLSKSKSHKAPITIQILNFHKSKKLLPVYVFDGVAYSDNGQHNDKVAGDGVFTSTKPVKVSAAKPLPAKRYITSPDFKYKAAFDAYLNAQNAAAKYGIGVKCKARIITCPETDWWNTCWPLSSPCSCVEFYDCEFEIGVSF